MKTPRALTLADANPAMLRPPLSDNRAEMHFNELWLRNRFGGQLVIANALNDFAVANSLAGLEHCPYLPGDMVLCKLNLLKMKKPRRNPHYRPVLYPCDQRAAINNGS